MRASRRSAVLSLIGAGAVEPLSAAAADDFPEKVVRFHDHWNRFFRAYLGCPKGATDAQQCNPKLGTFDYDEFNKAAKEARALFSLEPK